MNRKLLVYLSAAFLLLISSAFVSAQTKGRKAIAKPKVKQISITRPKIERKANTSSTTVKKTVTTPTIEQKAFANSTTIVLTPDRKPRLENDFVIHREAGIEKPKVSGSILSLPSFNQMLLSAIEDRLGTPYRYGSEGPKTFDCSGFVWNVFQQVGVNFERGSARTLWSRFEPATEEDKTKFGTLVFFNKLRHVGIVADANGFYHASTSKGIMYSTFNDYWTKRLVGFRRVPLAITNTHGKSKVLRDGVNENSRKR